MEIPDLVFGRPEVTGGAIECQECLAESASIGFVFPQEWPYTFDSFAELGGIVGQDPDHLEKREGQDDAFGLEGFRRACGW